MTLSIVGGSERREGGGEMSFNGKNIEYKESFKYLVYDSSGGASRSDVLFRSGVPIPGITRSVAGIVCTHSSANRKNESRFYWDVDCTFSTISNDQQPDPNSNDQGNPTTWVPIYKMGHEVIQEMNLVDANGRPAVNSALCPFDMGIPLYRTITTHEFYQFFPDTLTEFNIAQMSGIVNSKPFKGFPELTLLLEAIGSERGVYNGYPARKIDFRLKRKYGAVARTFKEWDGSSWVNSTKYQGWRELRYDAGPYFISGGKKKTITDDMGARMFGSQGLLDGSGGLLAYNANPIVFAFDIYPSVDFNSFLRV